MAGPLSREIGILYECLPWRHQKHEWARDTLWNRHALLHYLRSQRRGPVHD